MPGLEHEQAAQFEAALTDEVYECAWRYAWRLAGAGRGCREEAEDLLQEALTHAWRQFGQLRNRSVFKSWLLAIVRTRHLNRLRTQRRRPLVDGEPALELVGPPAADSLGDGAQAALAQLAPAERALLELFYLEGLSLEETGRAAGLSARVVRQRLYRARQSLRRVWHQLDPQLAGPARPQPETSFRRNAS